VRDGHRHGHLPHHARHSLKTGRAAAAAAADRGRGRRRKEQHPGHAVPVELLRFFDKLTPPAPAGEPKSAADSASLADFGNEDVAKEEAEIQSGAPLEIPEVPPIPTSPMQAGNGKLTAAVVAPHNDDADPGA
jgi:hypothetical protein